MSLDGLEIVDRVQTEDFIRLAQFKTSGIVFDLHPNRLQAAEVLINKPHARVTIDQNGAVNVVQAFAPVQKNDQKGKDNLLQRLIDFLILQIKGPMPMAVDIVQLNNFSGDFVDGSVAPPYTTHLEISKGTVKGLSSDPSAQADFKIEGIIDQSATIESAGQMNPMNALQYSKVDFALKDFDLKPVSTYSAKYAGYKITEGKLHLELKYHVDNDVIEGDNRIYIDQLALGEKVDSPDAPNLPLALGAVLLKDGDGRNTLQVPVGGNVKDPQFDIGQAVKSALTKTIDDVGNSPFSTITEIGGFKGEELHFIEFEAGHSKLDERATKKLNALAKFLNERTTITLGIEGTANQQIDLTNIFGKQPKKTKAGRQAEV